MAASANRVDDLYSRFRVGDVKKQGRVSDPRSPVAKDRDRLIHSSAFRRLQGKSQIVGVEVGDFFRTRITHSLECAQIGRAIAAAVAGTEETAGVVADPGHLPDLVEAACLAHDLGHPPFGHNGEVALRNKMREYNGSLFEGNAQSFRIVTRLEPKGFGATADGGLERPVGLDLTRATLRAIAKYPYSEKQADRKEQFPKFGLYDDPADLQYFRWVWSGTRPVKNLAARIMDVADDIAYAVHDFEDGVWAEMIPIRDLLDEGTGLGVDLEDKVLERDREEGLFGEGDLERTLKTLFGNPRKLAYIRRVGFDRTREARAELKNFTAALIGDLILAVTGDGRFREPAGDTARILALLKGMAFQWMIERTDIETHQYGQRRLVERIFDGYWLRPQMLPRREEWTQVEGSSSSQLTYKLRRRWPEKARLICDHVAGMTDGYAREVYDQMHRATQRRDLRLTY